MIEFLRQPWPWYVAGLLIGLVVPLLLLVGNKRSAGSCPESCKSIGRIEQFI